MKTLAQISVRQPLPRKDYNSVNCLAGYPVRCVRFPLHAGNGSCAGSAKRLDVSVAGVWFMHPLLERRTLALIYLSGCLPDAGCLVKRSATITGMFLADGAGSVSQGGEGAMLASMKRWLICRKKCRVGNWGLRYPRHGYCADYSSATFCRGRAKELAVRDFACTFLGLISSAMAP